MNRAPLALSASLCRFFEILAFMTRMRDLLIFLALIFRAAFFIVFRILFRRSLGIVFVAYFAKAFRFLACLAFRLAFLFAFLIIDLMWRLGFMARAPAFAFLASCFILPLAFCTIFFME